MNMAHPLHYLRFGNIRATDTIICCMPNCDNHFVAQDGVAFEGRNSQRDDEVHIYLFCSYECYLGGLPSACCAKC